MALHHKVLPPTVKIDRPNPELDLANSPVLPEHPGAPVGARSRSRAAWRRSARSASADRTSTSPSRSTPAPARRAPRLRAGDAELVVLAAADGRRSPRTSGAQIDGATTPRLPGVAGADEPARLPRPTRRPGSPSWPRTRPTCATSSTQAAERLDAIRPTRVLDAGWHRPSGAPRTTGDVAFVFPGQGSQYRLDGRRSGDDASATAMAAWDVAADVFRDPRPSTTSSSRSPVRATTTDGRTRRPLTATEWAQPALAATSLAMLRVLRALGLERTSRRRPQLRRDHRAARRRRALRGRRDPGRPPPRRADGRGRGRRPGSMTAVSGADRRGPRPRRRVRAPTSSSPTTTARRRSCCPGPTTAIEQVEEALADAGARRQAAARGDRVPLAGGQRRQHARSPSSSTPSASLHRRSPVYANETAEPYPTDDLDGDPQPARPSARAAGPLRRDDRSDVRQGARTFVEVGPSAVLTRADRRDPRGPRPSRRRDGREAQGRPRRLPRRSRPARRGGRGDGARRRCGRSTRRCRTPHEQVKPKLTIPISGAELRASRTRRTTWPRSSARTRRRRAAGAASARQAEPAASAAGVASAGTSSRRRVRSSRRRPSPPSRRSCPSPSAAPAPATAPVPSHRASRRRAVGRGARRLPGRAAADGRGPRGLPDLDGPGAQRVPRRGAAEPRRASPGSSVRRNGPRRPRRARSSACRRHTRPTPPVAATPATFAPAPAPAPAAGRPALVVAAARRRRPRRRGAAEPGRVPRSPRRRTVVVRWVDGGVVGGGRGRRGIRSEMLVDGDGVGE